MQQVKQRDRRDNVREDQDENQWEEIPEEEMQTVHVYVYEDQPLWWTKDRVMTAIIGILTLALIVGLCCLPGGPSYQIQTIRVPARFMTITLKTTVTILPTGKHVYPATRATGTLTIYNGSFLSQPFPAHFLFTTSSGIEVATSQAVLIPGANLPSLGVATVAAYVVLPGSQGNIQPDAIQATYGASIEIKNLSAFTGGQDPSTKTVVTANDQTTALETARAQLAAKQPIGLQSRSCTENISQQSLHIVVRWLCQYATYQAPKGVQILAIHLSGTHVVLTVKFVARSVTTHFVK